MPLQTLLPGLHTLPGQVNLFLLEDPTDPNAGITVIDTGLPGAAPAILEAVRSLGRQPSDIRHILLTHAHPDHIGSAGALQKLAPGARTSIHPADAAIARAGTGFRPLHHAPGLFSTVVGSLVIFSARKLAKVDPTRVDHEIEDGATLPAAGGLTAHHAPGHCAGQLVFLWPRHGGVLFAADACMNILGPRETIVYEDTSLGRQSRAKIARLPFEVACFGHGKPILKDAATILRGIRP